MRARLFVGRRTAIFGTKKTQTNPPPPRTAPFWTFLTNRFTRQAFPYRLERYTTAASSAAASAEAGGSGNSAVYCDLHREMTGRLNCSICSVSSVMCVCVCYSCSLSGVRKAFIVAVFRGWLVLRFSPCCFVSFVSDMCDVAACASPRCPPAPTRLSNGLDVCMLDSRCSTHLLLPVHPRTYWL